MHAESSLFSRGGPAMAVIGLHIILVYGLVASVGLVEVPKVLTPITAVFVPTENEVEPEPEMKIEPELDIAAPVSETLPDIEFEEPTVPVSETPMPASETAIAATSATSSGAVAQELKTSHRVDPTYPPMSRRLSEQGTVRVKVLVDERGRARDVQIAKSSGFARLDEAAMQAVRKWRFVAATDGANAISAWTHVAVTFKLTSA